MFQPERQAGELRPYADNFTPVISTDHAVHTHEHPFCYDQTCPCHEDEDAIAAVNQAIQDGLMTSDEATDFVSGKLL